MQYQQFALSLGTLFLPNPNWYVRRVVVRVLYFFERFFHVNFKHMAHMTAKSLWTFQEPAIWWTGILRWRFASIGSSTQLHRLRFSARSIKKPWSLVWSSTWAESSTAVVFKRRGFYCRYIHIIYTYMYQDINILDNITYSHWISRFTAFNRNPHIRPLYFAHQRQNLWMLLTCLRHYPKLSFPPFQAASMSCLLLQHEKQSSWEFAVPTDSTAKTCEQFLSGISL